MIGLYILWCLLKGRLVRSKLCTPRPPSEIGQDTQHHLTWQFPPLASARQIPVVFSRWAWWSSWVGRGWGAGEVGLRQALPWLGRSDPLCSSTKLFQEGRPLATLSTGGCSWVGWPWAIWWWVECLGRLALLLILQFSGCRLWFNRTYRLWSWNERHSFSVIGTRVQMNDMILQILCCLYLLWPELWFSAHFFLFISNFAALRLARWQKS